MHTVLYINLDCCAFIPVKTDNRLVYDLEVSTATNLRSMATIWGLKYTTIKIYVITVYAPQKF